MRSRSHSGSAWSASPWFISRRAIRCKPDATAETIAIVKHAYGFDKPLPIQFLIWLGRVLTGDFGVSIATRRPVFLEVTDALSNTALLAMFAAPIAFLTGYVMGVVAGCFP